MAHNSAITTLTWMGAVLKLPLPRQADLGIGLSLFFGSEKEFHGHD